MRIKTQHPVNPVLLHQCHRRAIRKAQTPAAIERLPGHDGADQMLVMLNEW